MVLLQNVNKGKQNIFLTYNKARHKPPCLLHLKVHLQEKISSFVFFIPPGPLVIQIDAVTPILDAKYFLLLTLTLKH